MTDREDSFEIPKKARETFTEKNILNHLSAKDKENLEKRVTTIIDNCIGVDRDALSLLAYAAERKKIEGYLTRLEEFYKKELQYVHPDARKLTNVAGAKKAVHFFIGCYEELGIQPQTVSP